jgi:quercetin dioxygenase-like cupin family protein
LAAGTVWEKRGLLPRLSKKSPSRFLGGDAEKNDPTECATINDPMPGKDRKTHEHHPSIVVTGFFYRLVMCKRKEYRMKKLIYGIFFALLFSSNVLAADVNAVHVDVLARTSLSWDGSYLPNYPKGTPEVTILRIKIPPGVQLPLHKHSVINAGVLLKGELTVVTEDNKTLHLKPGEPIVEVVNKWHYGKNEGNETAEIVVFYAGALDTPITIEK